MKTNTAKLFAGLLAAACLGPAAPARAFWTDGGRGGTALDQLGLAADIDEWFGTSGELADIVPFLAARNDKLPDKAAGALERSGLSADLANQEGDAPLSVPQPAQVSTTLQGSGLLAALHEETTLNGRFKARTYPEARFFMYSRADVIEKNGVQGIMEVYAQIFMEGVAGPDGCHVECADANGDSRINFDDYVDEDRDRCLKNEFVPSGLYPQARCKAAAVDLNHDGKPGDFVNAEHLWPQSAFGKQEELKGDLYNLLPTFAVPNAKRGNNQYGRRGFMPPEEIRGRIARAMFYFATAYHDRIAAGEGRGFFIGMIPELMEWNRSFPPGAAEKKRNELVSEFQGNRNPFIDDPALADRVGEAAWSNIFR